jgi:DNA topoisomerase VI subunit B
MKIAALQPQFIVESPPSVERTEEETTVRDLHHLKVVQPQTIGESPKSQLHEETLVALRRLGKKLKGKTKKDDAEQRQKKRNQAIAMYARIASSKNAAPVKGGGFDGFG